MDKPPVYGLTLAFFHRFVDDHGGRDCFQGLTTLAVCEQFVKPYTTTSQLSLVDHVLSQPRGHEDAKPAQWLISHSWSYQFLDVVDAIDGFCHEQELSPDTSFWFCMFANNQQLPISDPSVMFGHFLQAFRTALEYTGKMVMVLSPWHDPETLKRTWCVYEVYLSIVLNARVEVAMGTTQKLEFLADIKNPNSILRMLGQIKSSNSITTEPSDRVRIFELIENQVGFVKLDRMVFNELQGWIMQALDKQIELATTPEDRFEWVFTKAMRLFEESKYDGASTAFQLSVDIFKASLSPSFWQGWEAQLYVGTCSAKQRLAQDTWEPTCEEALSKLQSLVGRDHPALFRALSELGDAYRWNGHFDRGMPLLVEASQLADEFHGPQERLKIKDLLGNTFMNQRKLTQAEAKLRPSYNEHCQLYGPAHRLTGVCRENLAVCCALQGLFGEAEGLIKWNIKEYLRTHGEVSSDILASIMNLAVVQRLFGKYDEAETNAQKSLEGFQREGNQVYALHVRRNLAMLRYSQGNLVEAKTCLEALHAAYAEAFSPSHPSCRHTLSDLFIVRLKMGSEFDSVQGIAEFQQFLETAGIANDTWSFYCCHKCYKSIDGDLAICAQCPRHSVMFCKGCLTVPNAELVCGHHNGPWDVIPHPTRYLREQKAHLLAKQSLPEDEDGAKYVKTSVPRAFLLFGTTIAAGIVLLVQHRRGKLH